MEYECPYKGFCKNLKKPDKTYNCYNFENCPSYQIIKKSRETWFEKRDKNHLDGKLTQ